MTPYILFIIFICVSPFVTGAFTRKIQKKQSTALKISMIALFLIFALRASSVGRDIPGYEMMYERFSYATFQNFNRIYWTENGYNLLELVFSHYLKCPWQLFVAVIYGFVTVSYYFFWKRYSSNPIYSLLIYIFLGYFILDLSATRTALALAICLFAVPSLHEQGLKPLIKYLLLTLLAAQIHSSAYIFLLLYFVPRIRINKYTIICAVIIPLLLFAFRSPIISFVILTFKRSAIDTGISFGGFSIIYLSIIALSLLTYFQLLPQYLELSDNSYIKLEESIMMPMKMVYFGSLFTIFVGENVLARMAQYGIVFTTILIPNTFNKFTLPSKLVSYLLFTIFMVIIFYVYKIKVNELDFLPYVFFWNA